MARGPAGAGGRNRAESGEPRGEVDYSSRLIRYTIVGVVVSYRTLV